MFRRKIKRVLKSIVSLISIFFISLILTTIVYGFFYELAILVNYLVPLQ